MEIYRGRYVISRNDTGDIWAEAGNSGINIMKGNVIKPEEGLVLFTIKPDQILRMDSWSHPESLIVGFTGVLSRQIKDLAKGASLSPENFVLEGLNAFIQAGEMANQDHAHSQPKNEQMQPIMLEKTEDPH
jgi:hypothetical protein